MYQSVAVIRQTEKKICTKAHKLCKHVSFFQYNNACKWNMLFNRFLELHLNIRSLQSGSDSLTYIVSSYQ